MGVDINNDNIIDLGHIVFDFPVRFIFYLKKDIDLKNIVLKKDEVESVSYLNKSELDDIIAKGLMHNAHAKILEQVMKYKTEKNI